MNENKLSKDVIREVGGQENIESVAACATRLRFVLKDRSKANKEKVEKLEGVITVIESGGMFQIVIGNEVNKVYNAVNQLLGDNQKYDTEKSKDTIANRLISTIASIFGPLFGVMAGAGLIKGLLSMLNSLHWIDTSTGVYKILNVAGDSFFYFLPVILAISAAKKFKANQFIAVALAGALIHPDLVAMFTEGTAVDFLGIPVILVKYSSTVIPIVIAVWVLSKLEKLCRSKISPVVSGMLTPFICLVIMVPATLIVLGPISSGVANTIAGGFSAIYNLSPILAGILLGGLWQVLVIFGVHWGITAVVFNNLALLGYDAIGPLYAPSLSAQAGSALGVYLKTKDKELKQTSLSATITAIFGITEPAVYGVNLKLKKPFYYAVIAGAIGGGIAGYSGATAVSFVTKTVFTLPAFMGHGFVLYVIAFICPFFISLALTLFLGFEDVNNPQAPAAAFNDFKEKLVKPVEGKVIPLSEVKDEVFSKEVVGKGVAIIPAEGKLYSPVNGVVQTVFPTRHAYGIISDSGVEILMHIGLDTVNLQGKYFESKVKDGQAVKAGELLAEFNLEEIKNLGYDTSTEVIITNSKDYESIKEHYNDSIILEVQGKN